MARFFGMIGFGETTEIAPGVYEDVITEKPYYGSVINDIRRADGSDKVNTDITLSNAFSVVADAYANEHIYAMRYIQWAGVLWTITTVEVKRPRLTIRIGEVYNGPTPNPAP